MARIAGIDLPNKQVVIALTFIYGIGKSLATRICTECGIAPTIPMSELDKNDVNTLRKYIEENLKIEGDLRTSVSLAIKRLVDIRCYRGIRHAKSLPLRGQRTRTNARTRKGKRKTVARKKK